jgi:hypothetical protein
MYLTNRKRTYQVTAGILAVGILGILSPRAAHAVTAALVQVVNTTANPVVTVATNSAAADQILLGTPSGATLSPGSSVVAMNENTTVGGLSNSAYVVPAGQSVVVTGMDITAYTKGGAYIILRSLSNGFNGMEPIYVANPGTQLAQFSSGIVFPSGSSVYVQNSNGLGTTGSADVSVHGYLTAN